LHDTDVVNLALREGQLLITEDKDFGDLVVRRGHKVPGFEADQFQAMRLAAAIERYAERLFGHHVVVEKGRFRSRPL